MQSSTPILTARLIRRNCFNLWSQLAVRIVSQLQWTRRAAIEPSNSRRNGGVVADCVYRSNSWGLCDVDNRAFAVQAANTFLGQADQIASKPETFSANQTEVGIPETESRILDSIQYLVRNGVLIASDFAP